ncbi:MAG: hypothetical protein GF398_05710 [Chitinivibrionales bacterium]|nr:hypothetical protein [Chitinivibrionales bacterium]
MNHSKLIAATLSALLIAGAIYAQDCPWFTSRTRSGEKIAVCAERSSIDVPNDEYVAQEPDNYSVIGCHVGDTLSFKFIVGKDTEKSIFYGHMTRNVSKSVGTDVTAASNYFFTDVNAGHFRNMFAYPNQESGFILNSSQTQPQTGFNTSYENLVTVKIIVPEKGGQSSDNWDLRQYPMWIAISQYHKDSPLYFCLDATGGTTKSVVKNDAIAKNPIAVARTAAGLVIDLADRNASTVSVLTPDGRTILRHRVVGNSITLQRDALGSGMYVLDIAGARGHVSHNIVLP